MAGKAGRSGSGGAREGAGRKPNEPDFRDSEDLQTDDPVEFLRAVMRDTTLPMTMRADAAKKLLANQQRMAGDAGKKGAAKSKAAEVAQSGRFAPSAPPKLVAVK